MVKDGGSDETFARGVIERVAKEHGIKVLAITAENRDNRCVSARSAVAKELRACGWSYKRIGAVLERQHSTVMYLLKRT